MDYSSAAAPSRFDGGLHHECRGVRAELPDSHVPGHGGDRAAGSGHPGLRVRLHRFHPAESDPDPRADPESAGQPGACA